MTLNQHPVTTCWPVIPDVLLFANINNTIRRIACLGIQVDVACADCCYFSKELYFNSDCRSQGL